MKNTKKVYDSYELGNGFIVEVGIDEDEKEIVVASWLYHEKIGIKFYAYGWPLYQEHEKKLYSYEEATEVVIDGAIDCIELYKEEYMEN